MKKISTKKSGTLNNKVETIIQTLKDIYPNVKCSLEYETPYQLLVATILSAQCTDERVNKVTPELFRHFPDADKMSKASLSQIEKLIQSTGFYKNKALSLKDSAEEITKKYKGEIPRTIEELTSLRGVGRKTANVVLGNAYHIESGVVVDTHVGRLTQRMGITKNKTPEKIEQDLIKLVPQKDWTIFSHLMIYHGRARCMARNPDCGGCELKEQCPKIGVNYKPSAPKSVTHKRLNKLK